MALAMLAGLAMAPARLDAQWGLWPADSLLANGRLASAESAYYAASRIQPRDPVARAALGGYLAARSATRVGVVLLEEARFFGGDSAALARALVPLLVRLNDYRALVELQPDVLTAAERRRAAWLSVNAPEAQLRDSVLSLAYRPLGDGSGLGTVMLRLGRSELPAVIDPRVNGLVLPASARRDIRVFGSEGGKTIGVAATIRVGGAAFSNIPAVVDSAVEKVRVGFDVLAPYYPSFDPASGLITLRRVDRRAPPVPGPRIPALYDTTGLRLLVGGHWQPTSHAMTAMLLATRKWLWDWKLGDVVLVP